MLLAMKEKTVGPVQELQPSALAYHPPALWCQRRRRAGESDCRRRRVLRASIS